MRPKSIIISHGHLDHCGLIPNLVDLEPEIYSTVMTSRLTGLLAKDTLKIAQYRGHVIPYYNDEIQEFERKVNHVNYRKEFETNGYFVCFFDAGHIPGSSMIHLEKDKKSLFYTGDVNLIPTELQNGADKELPEADVLMIESTYFGKDHTPRKLLEERFIESVKETVDSGGCALIPVFSIGRTQEIMMILKKYGLNAHVDGMGVDVYNLMKRSPEFVKDPKMLDKAFTGSNIVDPEERKRILKNPSIIVTSAGMLNGGPVLYYIREIYDDPKSKIHLTGYQAQDTNGRKLLESGYIEDKNDRIHLNCRAELYDFSAHSGDVQLRRMVREFCDSGTEIVFTVHGDNTEGFAEWIREELGVESKAPVNGETIYI